MTPLIKATIKRRQKAFHVGNKTLYRSLRNKVIRISAKAKKQHYVSRVKSLKQNDPADWHRCLRQILNSRRSPVQVSLPDSAHLNDSHIADLINNHFSAIVNELPPLDLGSLPSYLPSPTCLSPGTRQAVMQDRGRRPDRPRYPGPDQVS